MKKRFFMYVFMWMTFTAMQAWSQGVTRAHGLGVRGGFWKSDARTLSVNVSSDENVKVDVGGAGGCLYFFSRISQGLFAEGTLGAVGNVHVDSGSAGDEDDVEVSALIPLLFGLRYDFLPASSTSSIEPYVGAGMGTYWYSETNVGGDSFHGSVSTESDFSTGMYLDFGTHVMLRSWFGLNFDTKYHFVNFDAGNENSGMEFGFGLSFMWGRQRELFRVRDIKVLVNDIYPAYYQFYSTYPVALLTVTNTAGQTIEVNVRSDIKGFSQRDSESGFVTIPKGETKDIPVHVFLGPKLLELTSRESAVLDLLVEARAGVELKKTLSANLMLHGRNAWDGEIKKLGFFVTPESDSVQSISRWAASMVSDTLAEHQSKMALAERLFEILNKKHLRYQSDPNIPFYQDDRVQFADNTLSLGTGDCDDLVVLYASLLESLGIRTAFVDVRDPEKSIAHVYLMFDTGLAPEHGHLISSNEKRYIIRENQNRSSIWIPVETTYINRSFEDAWEQGALAYLEDGIIRNGLAQGWMSVVEVQ